jgi:ComF family protein
MLHRMSATAGAAAFRQLASLPRRTLSGLRRLAAPYCAVCRVEHGDPVCPGCLRDFFDPDCARCTVCGARVAVAAQSPRCGRCVSEPPAFDLTLALGDYAPPLDGMVMALKSGGRLDLARVFADLLAARIGPAAPFDCLLAVPLEARRQRARGFNQSLEIARGVARRLALPLRSRALRRARAGPAQQSLPLAARRGNVRGAFVLQQPLRAPRAAVVDDVMTSGATFDELARVLKRAGVEHVTNLVVARTA